MCLLHQLVVDDLVLGLIGGIHEEDVLLFRSHRSHSATGHVGVDTGECSSEKYSVVTLLLTRAFSGRDCLALL